MGDLEPWMDESFLKQLWSSYGESVIIKLMRDKRTGYVKYQMLYTEAIKQSIGLIVDMLSLVSTQHKQLRGF